MELESLLQRISAFGSDELSIGRGEVLFRQGDVGDDFFIVASGRLRAVVDLGGENQRVVGEIGRGEPVGEMAVLGECERGATVIAIRRSSLRRVSKQAYEHLRAEHPGELIELLAVIALRLKRSYEAGSKNPQPSCIAIVPTNPAPPLDEYCARFIEALAASAPRCRLLRARDVPPSIDDSDGTGTRIAHWLNEQESAHDTIVLQADDELTPWTRRCLHQADLVLLLGKAGSDPEPGPAEAALAKFSEPVARPRVDLVLLQDAPPYSGTAEWLAPRSVTRHYHVCLSSEADRGRLHRLLGRTDISLVLGGGGARGLAHIGVVRACAELGIPIDRVGGTSIGALIGGWVAVGAGWQEIAAAVREGFPSGRKMRSRTLPAISFDTGMRYVRAIGEMFGDTMIEDLPINYFCVSSNVSRARVQAHRGGSLATWVGTSMSIPGIAPPYVLDGDLLVDGGILNNLPVDIACEDGVGRVIAIDVSPDSDLVHPRGTTGRPGNWEALRSWLPILRGQRPRSPSLFALLNRVSMLSSTGSFERNRARADILIRMPVNGFKMFAWEKIDELIELGYRAAMEQLRPLAGGS